MYLKNLVRYTAFVFLFSSLGACSNAPITRPMINEPPPNLTLDTFQRLNITQWDLEPTSEKMKVIEEIGTNGIKYITTPCQKVGLETKCQQPTSSIQSIGGLKVSSKKNSPNEFIPFLKRKAYSSLVNFTEREIQIALGGLSKNEVFALGRSSIAVPCKIDSVLITFGAKLEEFFPEKTAIEMSLRHYEKAHSCSNSNRSHRAAYRAGMIRNWLGEHSRALNLYRPLLSTNVDSSLRIRALYWTHRLKGLTKTPEGEKLLKDYPFSLHALLIRGSEQLDYPEDVIIETRSPEGIEFNEYLLHAEAYLALGDRKSARAILENAFALAQAERPELLIYYAYLLGRVGSYNYKFRALTPVLKSTNHLSKASLRLLFPEKPELDLAQSEQVPDLHLLLSLIRQESSFDPNAVSRAGAIGLMQLMPDTASMLGAENRESLFEPVENIRLGTKYLQSLISQYKETEYALAAYNAGPHRIETWLKRYNTNDKVLFVDLIPFRETREYIALIARNYFFYSNVYASSRLPASAKIRNFKIFDQAFADKLEPSDTKDSSKVVHFSEASNIED